MMLNKPFFIVFFLRWSLLFRLLGVSLGFLGMHARYNCFCWFSGGLLSVEWSLYLYLLLLELLISLLGSSKNFARLGNKWKASYLPEAHTFPSRHLGYVVHTGDRNIFLERDFLHSFGRSFLDAILMFYQAYKWDKWSLLNASNYTVNCLAVFFPSLMMFST